MFKNIITTTALTTEGANEFFGEKIGGGTWNRDITFLTTLRALLAPRMKDEDFLCVAFTDTAYNAERVNDYGDTRAVRSIVENWIDHDNEIHIHNFRSAFQEANTAWIDAVERCFLNVSTGWRRVEKVTVFFHKVFRVLCYINPELRSVTIFTDGMDIRRMHYLQCGIFAFIPWYFDPEVGVTDLEMELINSLREKTSAKYEECIAKIAAQYDFETARIRNLLRGFETKYEQMQCDRIRNEIDRALRNLESLDRQYAECLRNKRDYEATLMGLEMKISENGDESEIMDFFIRNKQLSLRFVRGNVMEFVVKTTLDFFDEELAARVIDNENSILYGRFGDRYRGQITADDMKILAREIFINQMLRIRVCAAYQFEIGGTVVARSNYEFGPECASYFPNPHINRYSCLGTYKRTINERLKENDYIGAITQCISSAKSLNFGDGAVMEEFACKMYGTEYKTKKFIEDQDGNLMTVKEAVDWARAHQQNEEEAGNGENY